MRREHVITWVDEMRVGLHGTSRRVWGRRGVKIVQPLQIEYEWRYVFLAVDGRSGWLWWTWLDRLNELEVACAVGGLKQHTPVEAIIWDRASAHRADLAWAVGLPLLLQPPHAPELNPAERVFQEVRRTVEGRVYPSIEAKLAAVQARLTELEADPATVRRLAGWSWLVNACDRLPARQNAA